MSATALLVIDIQRAAFDGVRCPPMDSPDVLVRSAGRLIEAARAGGRPIVYVQHCEGKGEPFEEGSVHWQLHESLVPARDEVIVRKYRSSSFEGTDLQQQLDARNVKALVLCGLQSDFCVSNTARSALELGYTVCLASDGHGTWPSSGRTAAQIRQAVNDAFSETGASVKSSDVLADELRKP